jgi:hypothetical protein
VSQSGVAQPVPDAPRHRRVARYRTPLRVGVAAVLFGLVVSGVVVSIAVVRSADPPAFASHLIAMHSTKCLTGEDGSRSDGAPLIQQGCGAAAAQRFEFRARSGGYQIRIAQVGACLAIRRGATANGTPLIQRAECDGAAAQRFTLRPVAGFADAFLIVAWRSGKCLDVKAGAQDDGTPVIQWSCGDSATAGNQVWKVALPAGVAPRVEPAISSREVAVTSDANQPGSSPARGGTPGGPAKPVATNPLWGRAEPPAGARPSRAYQAILGANPRGYHPRPGECSREVHARYWTWGPDGKVYPTWHPPRDPSGCAFGHEHGEDPRSSSLIDEVGWIPFGYANEQLAPSDPARQRDEDHVGHKIGAGDGIEVHATRDPASPVIATCDALVMMHQGLHSPDAFINNLHQLSYNVRCRYADSGAIEVRFTALLPIGHAGGFAVNEQCDPTERRRHDSTGQPTPGDAPDGFGDRFIADSVCALAVVAGSGDIGRINELWSYGLTVRGNGGLRQFEIMTFMFGSNPARYFDPEQPDQLGRTIDLCYRGAKGFLCDQARNLAASAGEQIPYDDPRSPFNGAARILSPNHLVVQNDGPPTLYSDVFGVRFSPDPFPGAIRQFIAGSHSFDAAQGTIDLPFRNFAANPDDLIHSPN